MKRRTSSRCSVVTHARGTVERALPRVQPADARHRARAGSARRPRGAARSRAVPLAAACTSLASGASRSPSPASGGSGVRASIPAAAHVAHTQNGRAGYPRPARPAQRTSARPDTGMGRRAQVAEIQTKSMVQRGHPDLGREGRLKADEGRRSRLATVCAQRPGINSRECPRW